MISRLNTAVWQGQATLLAVVEIPMHLNKSLKTVHSDFLWLQNLYKLMSILKSIVIISFKVSKLSFVHLLMTELLSFC